MRAAKYSRLTPTNATICVMIAPVKQEVKSPSTTNKVVPALWGIVVSSAHLFVRDHTSDIVDPGN